MKLPVERVEKTELGYKAMARKSSGDDPDVTHLTEICSEVVLTTEHEGIRFLQGEGVGVVTLPGWDWRSEALRSIRHHVR